MPAFLYEDSPDSNKIFTATRTGQNVVIKWPHDFSACKSIEILRNKTGVNIYKYRAASLKPDVNHYRDELPDREAHWYWIRVELSTGEKKIIGPKRVEPDDGNVGKYTKVSEKYPWKLVRDDTAVTINWDFPNIKYKYITITRTTNSKTTRGLEIVSTLEWSGKTVDVLPDPESDYWYRIECKLDDGTTILQGPIKVEFDSN